MTDFHSTGRFSTSHRVRWAISLRFSGSPPPLKISFVPIDHSVAVLSLFVKYMGPWVWASEWLYFGMCTACASVQNYFIYFASFLIISQYLTRSIAICDLFLGIHGEMNNIGTDANCFFRTCNISIDRINWVYRYFTRTKYFCTRTHRDALTKRNRFTHILYVCAEQFRCWEDCEKWQLASDLNVQRSPKSNAQSLTHTSHLY